MAFKTYKGLFNPKNPNKYLGNSKEIVYRSSWEKKLMIYLDNHPHVLKWASEELVIPYVSPIDNRVHRYFTDFYVEKLNKDGRKETIVIEVKPAVQTKPPKKQKRRTQRYLEEVRNWGVNSAKWEAADKYCQKKGWKFVIMTEHELGIK